MSDALAWPLALTLLGAVVGSFIATLVMRWPAGRSAARGRSRCDGCDRPVPARDLVPIANYLALRGRCRRCAARIDPRHWQIELAAALIGAAAGIAMPGAVAVAGATFGWLLLALAALDVAAFWLPDRLTLALAAAGLATGLIGLAPALGERLIGGAAGYASLAAIAFGYRVVRRREGLGGGDPKLFAGIGLWLGWRMLPAVVVVAGLAGLGSILAARLRGEPVTAGTRLPFGALLAVAAYPAWLAMVASAP